MADTNPPQIEWYPSRWQEDFETTVGEPVEVEVILRVEADEGFEDTQHRRFDILVNERKVDTGHVSVIGGHQSGSTETYKVPGDYVWKAGETPIIIRPFNDAVEPFKCGTIYVKESSEPAGDGDTSDGSGDSDDSDTSDDPLNPEEPEDPEPDSNSLSPIEFLKRLYAELMKIAPETADPVAVSVAAIGGIFLLLIILS